MLENRTRDLERREKALKFDRFAFDLALWAFIKIGCPGMRLRLVRRNMPAPSEQSLSKKHVTFEFAMAT
jgi:hypothetical protein